MSRIQTEIPTRGGSDASVVQDGERVRPLHRVFPIQITFPFLIAAAVFALLDGEVFLAAAAAVVCHECAHLLALTAFRLPVYGVDCTLSGIRIRSAEGRGSAAAALAGPIVNLIIGCAVLCLCQAAGQSLSLTGTLIQPPWNAGSAWMLFGIASLVLGVFHLLPLPGADGEALLGRLSPRVRERTSRLVCAALFVSTVLLCAAGLCHPVLPAAALAKLIGTGKS